MSRPIFAAWREAAPDGDPAADPAAAPPGDRRGLPLSELGRTFHEQGPGRTIAALATVFERLAKRGVLRLDDPQLAAGRFNWLMMSIPLNRAMFPGEDQPPPAPSLTGTRTLGVRTFVAA